MKNIFLGTTSQAKSDIVKSLLGENYNIIPINVDSGVTDQPLDEDMTVQGAVTRAKRAIDSDQSYEFSVGLEGGLTKINGLYYLVCVAVCFFRIYRKYPRNSCFYLFTSVNHNFGTRNCGGRSSR